MVKETVFAFWEGHMPDYLKLCMDTWHFPVVMLNYKNLSNYTDLKVDASLKRYTLPQIADVIRVHVLRDQGGYWLDTDTIMITDDLPSTNMIGDPIKRSNTIGYLHADKPHSELFEKWAEYQDKIISNPQNLRHIWSIMGNDFTDKYVFNHEDVTICSVHSCWPETYMISDDVVRQEKYQRFYFESSYHLSDILYTNMLMLHNSWTPDWYKKLSADEVLNRKCTMSNILKEVLVNDVG